MTGTAPRDFWAVEIFGDEFDLSGWEKALKSGFDPYVTKHPQSVPLLLRSSEFDGLHTAGEVRERALVLIAGLNGALRVAERCGKVSMGNVAEALTNGMLNRTLFGEVAAFETKFGRGDMFYSGALQRPPEASPAQRWIKLAAKDGVALELMTHFGRDDPNWFDLYKAYECLKTYTKTKDQLELLLGSRNDGELGRFKQTANFHRHGSDHSSRKNPPSDPMTLQEATEYIRGKIEHALNVLAPPTIST